MILAVLAFGYDLLSGWSLLVPAAVSIGLAMFHERVLRHIQLRAERSNAAGELKNGGAIP